jgi:GNAT superfamily N-acetyltransferase
MSVDTRKCTFAEIEANENFRPLMAEYAKEALIHDLAPPANQFAAYPLLEGTGMFHIWGAFAKEKLVGVIALILPVLPHYGVMVAVTESFFVSKDYRKQGAGLRLLRTAMHKAREEKAPGVLVSAPYGGRLAELLEKSPYFRETNRVFFRKFADA